MTRRATNIGIIEADGLPKRTLRGEPQAIMRQRPAERPTSCLGVEHGKMDTGFPVSASEARVGVLLWPGLLAVHAPHHALAADWLAGAFLLASI